MRISVSMLLVALTIGCWPVRAEQPHAAICNAMNVEVSSLTLSGAGGGFTRSEPLKPGACLPLPALPAGSYMLRFTERGANQAASCNRTIAFDPRVGVRIAPDDGSTCIL